VRDLVASFQKAVVDALVDRVRKSCRRHGVRNVIVSGGVACNSRLREEFERIARRSRLRVYFPSPRFTTDNAAMIAAAGFLHYDAGDLAPADLSAISNLRL
jgi:N6-L-threonylcarbamoyladenine synthase